MAKEKDKLETSAELPKEEGALDTFLESGVEPRNMGKALDDEAKKVNEQAKAEAEAMDKGEEPSAPISKVAAKESEDLISKELREKYKIPENIKTMKALVDWGPNAEKNMQKALSEKDKTAAASVEIEKRFAKMEGMLEQFSKGIKGDVKAGELSEEEAAIENEKMRYLMENNPAEFAKQIKEQIRKETLTQKQKADEEEFKNTTEKQLKEIKIKQAQEWLDMVKEYEDRGEKDKFENEVFPALKKIAQERPYLRSFEEARIIYEHNTRIAEEKAKADDVAKRKEKKELGSEASHKSAEVFGDGDDRLAEDIDNLPENASIADLDKVAKIRH